MRDPGRFVVVDMRGCADAAQAEQVARMFSGRPKRTADRPLSVVVVCMQRRSDHVDGQHGH